MKKLIKKFVSLMEKFIENFMLVSVKVMSYLGLILIFGLGIRIIYGAWFHPDRPGIGPLLFLTCMGGIFIFLSLLGYKHRVKIWS